MDVLIVGCGLSGSVVARELAEAGKTVQLWERRDHIAGNMYDYKDKHGFIVQKYGPHTFHTKEKKLFDYISKFSNWQKFVLKCGAEIDGKCTPTPFNFRTIEDFYTKDKSQKIIKRIRDVFGNREDASVLEVLSCDDDLIKQYAQFLFEKDYSLYTAKQWGISPNEIDPSVLKRVPLRFSYKEGYFDDPYQCMPQRSYTDFFRELLDHPNISIQLKIDALNHIKVSQDGERLLIDGQETTIPVVYTGALDELFDLSDGPLPYRSLRFEWFYTSKDSFQDYPVVAYPQAEGFTRITEFKKLQPQNGTGTTYAKEFPIPYNKTKGAEPYYPILTSESKDQYEKYKRKAEQIKNLFFCGRLADYKYYNMDQALSRALEVSSRLLMAHCPV